jgi:hypothetical protein
MRLAAVIIGLLTLTAFGVSPARALVLNEFAAAAIRAVSPVYDGLRGNMYIRTDEPTVPWATYVHITQADIGSLQGDFVAIGTAKGAGVDSCPDDFDPLWDGYYDGQLGALYFCNEFNPDGWGIGDNPSFRIERANCPSGGFPSWVLTFAGTTRTCISSSSTAAIALPVGLEVVTSPPDTTDRNIDVKYTNLNRNLTNSTTWQSYGTPAASDINCAASYTCTIVSSTSSNFYLAPLN